MEAISGVREERCTPPESRPRDKAVLSLRVVTKRSRTNKTIEL